MSPCGLKSKHFVSVDFLPHGYRLRLISRWCKWGLKGKHRAIFYHKEGHESRERNNVERPDCER